VRGGHPRTADEFVTVASFAGADGIFPPAGDAAGLHVDVIKHDPKGENQSMKLATGFALLTIAVASAYSISANAVETDHANGTNPTARCQGALPAFETQIRKRPLAVQNEGTANSFITCSFETDVGNATGNAPVLLDTYFSNNTAAAINLSCTAVTGFQGGESNEYLNQTITIPANGQGNLFWTDTDFENGIASGLISISCNIPRGVGINDTYIYWVADDLVDEPV
jgi:hypothetical protein